MNYFFEVLAGFCGGIFGGMGMGGGTLLIPILILFLNYEQTLAQGVNLMAFLVIALFSLFIHSKSGFLEQEGLFSIIFGGIFGAILGSILANFVGGEILKIIFGVFLIILGIFQLFNAIKITKNNLQK